MSHRDHKPDNMSVETESEATDRRGIAPVAADERPSIEAMRRVVEHDNDDSKDYGPVCAACHGGFVVPHDFEPSSVCNPCAQAFVADHASVLLEIAAAALAEQAARCDCESLHGCSDDCAALVASRAYHAALAKVRP